MSSQFPGSIKVVSARSSLIVRVIIICTYYFLVIPRRSAFRIGVFLFVVVVVFLGRGGSLFLFCVHMTHLDLCPLIDLHDTEMWLDGFFRPVFQNVADAGSFTDRSGFVCLFSSL